MTSPRTPTVRAWLRERPWIWLLLIMLLFIAVDAVFLKIAFTLPLEEIAR